VYGSLLILILLLLKFPDAFPEPLQFGVLGIGRLKRIERLRGGFRVAYEYTRFQEIIKVLGVIRF